MPRGKAFVKLNPQGSERPSERKANNPYVSSWLSSNKDPKNMTKKEKEEFKKREKERKKQEKLAEKEAKKAQKEKAKYLAVNRNTQSKSNSKSDYNKTQNGKSGKTGE